jgi:hypothetical protein
MKRLTERISRFHVVNLKTGNIFRQPPKLAMAACRGSIV